MITLHKFFFCSFVLFLPLSLNAQDYPEMEGLWKGHIRMVESPKLVSSGLATGGVIISEADLVLTIIAQDGEVFIGTSRLSTMSNDAEPIHVYGSIRSTGTEGLFIDSLGGHGQLWFQDGNNFEYCYSSLGSDSIISYCAKLQKE
ncbi:MAG: hypothetical protein COB20_05245 [SAR86 cluster bacterium]|uniref:TIGR03067 domain-containing protein n=1 Tax=SAR86 cluster bacterium TaxID=2030880 RepID=A0A2A4X9G0_9GAMM|nr:MAG: hypothetical protein COB20_05245 [SAR86 cluster bacterium]